MFLFFGQQEISFTIKCKKLMLAFRFGSPFAFLTSTCSCFFSLCGSSIVFMNIVGCVVLCMPNCISRGAIACACVLMSVYVR